MKRIMYFIAGLLLISPLAFASEVACFDPASTPVANQAYFHHKSANTPEYSGNPDCLINPDLSAVVGQPLRYWQRVGNDVELMDASEIALVDNNEATNADLAMRQNAKTRLDGQTSIAQTLRCLSDIIRKEVNILRQWTLDFKAETASSTSMNNFKSRVATLPDLGPDGTQRTLLQLKNQMQQCIDDGDVDE